LSVGYSSGNGGLLQTKLQAEPGIALQWQNGAIVQIDTTPKLRWISNGRTVLNNKGNPVKQYEPFFSTTFEYESEDALVEIGFTPVLYYDTLGRNIRTEFADGTISRVEFDAWKQLSFDQNDMVLDSSWYVDRGSPNPISPEPANPETRAAWLAAKHANTPGESHFDSLGRTIYSIANNGALGKYASTTILDIENNKRAVIDARNNTVVQFEYDMISRVNHQTNMDSGERWMLADGLSKPSFKWDDLKHEFIFEYDALHRPTKNWIIEDVMQSTPKKLIGLTVYGENQNSDKTLNLREKVFQIFDQSGLVETTEYDFKGNAKSSFKQLAKDYKNIISLDVVNPVSLLEVEQFSASSKFNAVNKPVELDMPDGSQIFPSYNETNLLKQVNVFINSQNQNIPFVQNITYDAKSQREKILYGNNTLTRYTYDEKAYRLKRILTTRNNGADILQDLNYTYDPVANITQIQDAAQQTIFFNNAGVIPENKFEYDAIYRLIHATGREHAGQNAPMDQFDFDKTKSGGQRLTLKGDMNAMQNYEQIYDYDNAGNMMHIIHNAGNGIFQNKWTQTFNYNPNNNQLHSIQVGANTTTFNYDAHGNQQNLQDNIFPLTWNYADQLQQIDLGGGGIVYYVYDSTGQRVRKVIENGNLIKERIYLTNYEIYRETQNNNVQLERETLHIMDDKERIALVETRTKGEDAGLDFLIRYQYSNHLRTACLEITGDQNNPEIISYEEYYPFGNTSYQAMRNQTETSKRYRYTGKERDEESGLYYHGARYYAPWLARWTASDPKGIDDGLNVYSYVNNNPIKLHDPTGGEGESNDKEKKPATPATTVTTPPQYSLLFPYTYQSWGDQVGKDSGATASFYFDIFKDSKQFDELKKLALDPQLNILKSGFAKEWDKNKPSLILGAAPFVLSTAGILTYLSVINPKLDIPIVGKTPARTIGFGALSLGFRGLSKLADDKFKLEVGYKEDDKTSKGTYSGELELQGDKGTSVKFGIGLGYEQSFKYGFTAPLTSDLKLSSEFEFKQKDTSRSFTATVAVPIKVGGTTLYFENKAFIQSGPTSTESPFSPKFNTDDLSKPAVSIFNQPFQGSGVFFSLTIPTSVPKKEEKK
jgi:RHS repeat-associated protein